MLTSTLTPEQLAAVEADQDRVVVDAGPGSGKTTVLAARIAWLLERVAPESIVALAFTRSACSNIQRKVADQVGEALADRVAIQTFHGFAYETIQALPLTNGMFNVATEIEDDQARRSLYHGPTRRRGMPGRRTLDRMVMEWEAGLPGHEDYETTLRVLRRRLRDAGLLPTWDLLPSADTRATGLHVLVDEAQDVTPRERQLALDLSRDGTLFVVGDDRQAIMGWRGARGMGLDATHRLTHSFRFGPEIAAAANHVAGVMGAEPIVGGGPPGWVVECGLEAILEQEGSRAVLCRTHRDCELVARELGDQAVHVRRDPLDALAADADRYEEIARRGLVAVTTVHAAKGRELDAVAIAPMPESDDPEETRVQYVSATRGRRWVGLVGA